MRDSACREYGESARRAKRGRARVIRQFMRLPPGARRRVFFLF
jgi:hypothetical protein